MRATMMMYSSIVWPFLFFLVFIAISSILFFSYARIVADNEPVLGK